MHSPRQSLGDSSTQPKTPCSASVEWGGRRSILDRSAGAAFWRRAFLKSAGGPDESSRESITAQADRMWAKDSTPGYWSELTGCSQSLVPSRSAAGVVGRVADEVGESMRAEAELAIELLGILGEQIDPACAQFGMVEN